MKINKVLVLSLLFLAAFFAVGGIAIHRNCEGKPTTHFGWVSVAGYDSEGYLNLLVHPRGLFAFNARHPLMSLEMAPMWFFGSSIAQRRDAEAGKIAVIIVFALVNAANAGLLWLLMSALGTPRVSRIAALALWLSFAHVWILGGIAESFSLSASFMLVSLLMLARGVKNDRVWLAMSVAAGGLTLTNGVKPALAWGFSKWRGWTRLRSACAELRRVNAHREFWWTLAGLTGCALLGAGVLCVKWQFIDRLGVWGGFMTIVRDIVECFPKDIGWGRRLWHVWNSFFCEPMMLHESVFAQNEVVSDYRSPVAYLLAATVYGLAIAGAVRALFGSVGVQRKVWWAALLFFAFDLMLHVVMGWGLVEGQIYCLHWLWLVPLLISQLPRHWAWGVLPLAGAIAFWNVAEALSGALPWSQF